MFSSKIFRYYIENGPKSWPSISNHINCSRVAIESIQNYTSLRSNFLKVKSNDVVVNAHLLSKRQITFFFKIRR